MFAMQKFDGVYVNDKLVIPEQELEEKFISIGGPGGQNVNKTATGVQLRWCISMSSIPDTLKSRLIFALEKQLSKKSEIVIEASRHRRQIQNRVEARKRLAELVGGTLKPRKRRIATKPSRSSQQKRITSKKKRGALKAQRSKVIRGD